MIGEGFAKDCLLRQSVSCEPELSLKRLKMPTVGGLFEDRVDQESGSRWM